MKSDELRQKFLAFFEKRGHKIIPSASLIPSTEVELSPTQKVLFTTAGMHPLIPYLLGKSHPQGQRLTNVQKCLRTDDIDEVGDAWHNTFFEMLGNWSLGSYWKKEAISWSLEFLTKELQVKKDKIWISVFGGDKNLPDIPQDEESIKIWQDLQIPKEKIIKLGKKDNFWGPVGEIGPCGPDAEIFIDTTGKPCGPNCQPGDNCGRFAEVWNDVFMQYDRQQDGSYKPLAQKNVDTGMGMERMVAVLQGKNNVYDTDLFHPIIDFLQKNVFTKHQYEESRIDKALRISADHLKSAIFLINDGVKPGNKERGYVLRRLIRRVILQKKLWGEKNTDLISAIDVISNIYKDFYPEMNKNKKLIIDILQEEVRKADKALDEAIKIWRSIIKKAGPQIFVPSKSAFGVGETPIRKFDAKTVFDLYQSYGLPIEITEELAKEVGGQIDKEGAMELFKKHQEISRKGLEKKFAGGLVGKSPKIIAGHTATHLLHQALRDVLGLHVHQTGSNITEERVRFDFSHSEKLNDDQIKKVEDLVNQKIQENLTVHQKTMPKEAAQKEGAIGLFKEKYGDLVSVYFIGPTDKIEDAYSKEFCGGPHAKSTGELKNFKIVKVESTGSGIRRIYAKIST